MKYHQLSSRLTLRPFPQGATHYVGGLFYKQCGGVVYYNSNDTYEWCRGVHPWDEVLPLPIDFILDNYIGDADVR